MVEHCMHCGKRRTIINLSSLINFIGMFTPHDQNNIPSALANDRYLFQAQ